jgi:hypothetical protein
MSLRIFEWKNDKERKLSTTAQTPEASARTDLAVRLRKAREKFNANSTKKRLLEQQIEKTTKHIQATQKILSGTDINYRETRLQELQEGMTRLRQLKADLPIIDRELSFAEGVLEDIRREITNHPVYAGVVREQDALVAEALQIANRSWNAPLSQVASLVAAYDKVADREVLLLRSANTQLIQLGLPEIRDRIYGCRESLPLFVCNFPLDILRRNAGEFFNRLSQSHAEKAD